MIDDGQFDIKILSVTITNIDNKENEKKSPNTE